MHAKINPFLLLTLIKKNYQNPLISGLLLPCFCSLAKSYIEVQTKSSPALILYINLLSLKSFALTSVKLIDIDRVFASTIERPRDNEFIEYRR